jgi:hypothetical protein
MNFTEYSSECRFHAKDRRNNRCFCKLRRNKPNDNCKKDNCERWGYEG